MREIITGKILKDQKVTRTGFLVAENIVVTAKHNVLIAEDVVDDGAIHEQEIWFSITEDESGKRKDNESQGGRGEKDRLCVHPAGRKTQ